MTAGKAVSITEEAKDKGSTWLAAWGKRCQDGNFRRIIQLLRMGLGEPHVRLERGR